jgi:hypothetical protein
VYLIVDFLGLVSQEINVYGTQPLLFQMSNGEALLTALVMLGAERATRTTAYSSCLLVLHAQKRENERTTYFSLSPSASIRENVHFTGVQGSQDQTPENEM